MTKHFRSMKKEFNSVMSEAHTMALIQVVRRHPDATLSDVGRLADTHGLMDLTVGQCFFDDLPRTGVDWAKQLGPGKARKALAAPKNGTRNLNLFRKGDREIFDGKVLVHLKKQKDWTLAIEIRAVLGGTPLQMRTSLDRLLQAGSVEYTGRARSTRYRAA